VGQFVEGLWECVCVVCGTVWCVFKGVSMCCLWGSWVLVLAK